LEFTVEYNDLLKKPIYPSGIPHVLNISNQCSQATRPKNVGCLSKIFPESQCKDAEEWEYYYTSNFPGKLESALHKHWDYILNKGYDKIENEENGIKMRKEYSETFVRDLMFRQTAKGFEIQELIMKKLASVCKTSNYRSATVEEERENKDIFVNDVSLQVKSKNYSGTLAEAMESIDEPIIYYKTQGTLTAFIIPDPILEKIKKRTKQSA
jgi:hypothetical protein